MHNWDMFQHVWEYQLELGEHFQATSLTASLAAGLPFSLTPLCLPPRHFLLRLYCCILPITPSECQEGKKKKKKKNRQQADFNPLYTTEPRGDDWQRTIKWHKPQKEDLSIFFHQRLERKEIALQNCFSASLQTRPSSIKIWCFWSVSCIVLSHRSTQLVKSINLVPKRTTEISASENLQKRRE